MTAVKRTDDVVRVMRKLVDRGVDAYLCLVGDGPDRDHLERYAHELGVVRRCLFLGYQQDVARFYDAIDVLLLPSVNEGTPVSVIEALAAAVPRSRRDVGGVSDVVRDGVDGFLADVGRRRRASPSGSPTLAADPERRAAMGAAGRERVLERYAVARLVDDVDRLYRALLATRDCSGLACRLATRGSAMYVVPAGLLLAGHGLEAGLPAAEGRLVLDEEPEHHVDARVLARDRVGLRHVLRLVRPARRRRSSCRAGSSGSRTR